MKLQQILLLFGRRYNFSIHAWVVWHAAKMCWHLSMLIHPGMESCRTCQVCGA